jgi:hypothetical protein
MGAGGAWGLWESSCADGESLAASITAACNSQNRPYVTTLAVLSDTLFHTVPLPHSTAT